MGGLLDFQQSGVAVGCLPIAHQDTLLLYHPRRATVPIIIIFFFELMAVWDV